MREHTIQFRVRYQETDRMGVVYYANYLVWFEVARTELFRAAGLDYRELEEKDNVFLPVAGATCRYRSPLGYDDPVSLSAALSFMGKARIIFEYEVRSEGRQCATGQTVHTFVNAEGTPVPVPQKVREVLLREA